METLIWWTNVSHTTHRSPRSQACVPVAPSTDTWRPKAVKAATSTWRAEGQSLKMGATSYLKMHVRYNLMGICTCNIYSCIFWGYRRGIIWMRWAWTLENWGYNGMHCIAKRFSDSHTIMAIWNRTNQQYDVGFVLKACRIYGMSNRDKMIHQQIWGYCTLCFQIETDKLTLLSAV